MLTLLALMTTPTADAADLFWSGHYTARLLAIDSLSLGSDNDLSEGLSSMLDHRVQLRPTWAISPNIGLHGHFDVNYLQPWGGTPDTYTDAVSGDSIPLASADGVTDPTFGARAFWADIYAPLGRVRFGRMPVEWGAGLLLNAGDDFNDKFGDTSDRVEFTTQLGPVFLEAAYDLISEGEIGEADDFHVANLAVAWRTENLGVGYLNRYRFQPSQEFATYTGDLWGKADFGTLFAELEFAFEIGGGDLDTGANDIDIASFGGMLDLGAQLGFGRVGMELGIASGDSNLSDSTYNTFSFDRDHDVAMLMFEQIMPVLQLAASNPTRSMEAARTGNSVSNAQYLRPWFTYTLRKDLSLTAHLLAARADKVDEGNTTDRGYGIEYGIRANYQPYEKLILTPEAAVFTPGSYFTEYTHPELGGGFGGPVYGGRILATVSF